MSRVFDKKASVVNRMRSDVGVWTQPDLYVSIFCWVKSQRDTQNGILVYSDATTPGDANINLGQYPSGSFARGGTKYDGTGNHAIIYTPDTTGEYQSWKPVLANTASVNGPISVHSINGLTSGPRAETNGFADPSNMRLRIGENVADNGNGLVGKLAHVAVWNRELTQAEIDSLVAGDSSPADHPDGLLEYWPMTDGATGDEVGVINGTVLTMTGTVPTDAEDNPVVGQSLQLGDVNGNNIIEHDGPIVAHGQFPNPITVATLGGYPLTVSDQTSTTVTFWPLNVFGSTLPFGTHEFLLDDALQDDLRAVIDVSLVVDTAHQYVTVAGVQPYLASGLAVVDGDQMACETSVAGSTLTLSPDTDVIYAPALPDGTTHRRGWYSVSAGEWENGLVEVLTEPPDLEPSPPTYQDISIGRWDDATVDLSVGWTNAAPSGFTATGLPSGTHMTAQGVVYGCATNQQTRSVIVYNSGYQSQPLTWTV